MRFAVYADGTIYGHGNQPLQRVPLVSAAVGNLGLTTAFQSFGTPVSVSLPVGRWVVTGTFYFVCGAAGDVGQAGVGQLVTTGGTATISNSGAQAVCTFETAATSTTVSQTWYVSVTATTTAEIKARKTGGAGTASLAFAGNTTLTAWYLGHLA
jgi:hypothetical protein